MADRNETIKAIKTALQKRSGKTWSVKGGRGTAYGWITISTPPARRGCARECQMNYVTDECNNCGHVLRRSTEKVVGCSAHQCTDRCYKGYITPEERAELAELLGLTYVHSQGVNIASSSAYYNEYVARAAGLTPAVVGTPYWD